MLGEPFRTEDLGAVRPLERAARGIEDLADRCRRIGHQPQQFGAPTSQTISDPTPKTMAMTTSVVTIRGARKPRKRVGGAAQAEHPARAGRCSDRRGRRAPTGPSATCRRRLRRWPRWPRRGRRPAERERHGRRLRCEIVDAGTSWQIIGIDSGRLSVRPDWPCRNRPIQQDADPDRAQAKKNAPKRVFKDPTEGDRPSSARAGRQGAVGR